MEQDSQNAMQAEGSCKKKTVFKLVAVSEEDTTDVKAATVVGSEKHQKANEYLLVEEDNDPTEEPKDKETPYMFECGTPYRFTPPPLAKGVDCWEEVWKPLHTNDQARCKSWKDEVQNVLIFASLFSAVVTAFIIESYKDLKPDPNDAVIILLGRIAASLDPAVNTSTTFPPVQPQVPFSPRPAVVRVNIFWILSLVVSLTTVLIGIVSSQWLREHQHYPEHFSIEEKFGLLNMRLEMMKVWYVPAFFASLPILLQLALILFFIGLVDFLHSLGVTKVTVPIIVAICFPLSFLLVTTALPALQVFTVVSDHAQINKNVPVPCPYKSPTARLLRLMLGSGVGFLLTQRTFVPAYSVLAQCIKRFGRLLTQHTFFPIYLVFAKYGKLTWSLGHRVVRSLQLDIAQDHFHRIVALFSSSDSDYQPYYNSLKLVNVDSWEELDLEWISVRRYYSSQALSGPFEDLSLHGAFEKDVKYGPQYDQIRGIQQVCYRYPNHVPILLSAYNCFVRCIAGADVLAGLATHDARAEFSWTSRYFQITKELLMSGLRVGRLPGEEETYYTSRNCIDQECGISYDEMFLVFIDRVLPSQEFVRLTLVEIFFRTCHYREDQPPDAEITRRTTALNLYYYNDLQFKGKRLLDFQELQTQYLEFVFYRLAQRQESRIIHRVFLIEAEALIESVERFLEGQEVPADVVVALGQNLDLSSQAIQDPSRYGFDSDEVNYLDKTTSPFPLSYSLILAYLRLRRSSTLSRRIPLEVLELGDACNIFCQVIYSHRDSPHVARAVAYLSNIWDEEDFWKVVESFESEYQELSTFDYSSEGQDTFLKIVWHSRKLIILLTGQLPTTRPAPGSLASESSLPFLPLSSQTVDQIPTTAVITSEGSLSESNDNEQEGQPVNTAVMKGQEEQPAFATSPQEDRTADLNSDNPYPSQDHARGAT